MKADWRSHLVGHEVEGVRRKRDFEGPSRRSGNHPMDAGENRAPAVLVSATHSGAGKTTVTRTLLAALRDRGLIVQPFKVGPDFIDPMYHAALVGRPSINLDVWMMGEDGIRDAYRRWSADADVVVIEAMGALFDGAGGTDDGSAAHVARILEVPVVVVLDVWGMTRTTAALMDGIDGFDPSVEVAGFVLNRVGSRGHRDLIESAVGSSRWSRVVADIEADAALEVAERHLGLVTTLENPDGTAPGDLERIARGLDPDRFFPNPLPLATSTSTPPSPNAVRSSQARLAVARDAAFCFYYEENLAALVEAGFEIVEFSPLTDDALPTGTDAVYLGGGYPESFASDLATNESLAHQLRDLAENGMPIYAECGGFIYLGRTLQTFDGERHQMAGVLPMDFAMDPKHLSIRYVELTTRADSLLGPQGTVIRGQEFHQSRVTESAITADLYDVTTSDGKHFVDGFRHKEVVASYMHLYLSHNSAVPANLAEAATGWRL